MTPEEYQIRRDELVALFDDAMRLGGLRPETVDDISQRRRRVLEGTFEIVLLGGFQCGKSTTLNALCDGRNVSPMGEHGGGIRTSACCISARPISDAAEPEGGLVRWKTDAELALGFADLLLPHLQAIDLERFREALPTDLPIRLSDPRDLDLIMEAAEEEEEIYEADRRGYDPEDVGRLDVLRYAFIVARFYGDPELEALRGRTEFDFGELQRLARFPDRFGPRFSSEGVDGFSAIELAFAFIGSIEVRLRSSHLSRLGCIVTDCPGLFASRFDTEVATKAMRHSDAIVFLCDGSREISQSEARQLLEVSERGWGEMLFVAANLRNLSFAQGASVCETTEAHIRDLGLDLQEHGVTSYGALMALLARQAQLLIDDRLDERGETSLLEGLGRESRDDALAEIEGKLKRLAAVAQIEPPEGPLDSAGASRYLESSRFPRLLDSVERWIVGRRSRSILLGNARRVAEALETVEGDLRSKEARADESRQEFENGARAADKALAEFEDGARRSMRELDNKEAEFRLGQEAWDVLWSKRGGCKGQIGKRILKEVMTLDAVFKQIGGDREGIKRAIRNIFREEVESWISRAMDRWVVSIVSGKNAIFKEVLTDRIQRVAETLLEDWKRISEESRVPLLQNIPLPLPKGTPALDEGLLRHAVSGSQLDQGLAGVIFLKGAVDAGVWATMIGALAAAVLLWSAPILIVIVGALAVLVGKDKVIRDKVKEAVDEAFEKLEDGAKDGFQKQVRRYVEDVRSLYKKALVDASGTPRLVLNQRLDAAREDYERADAERKELAQEARDLRTKKIAPLRRKLEAFSETCEKECGEVE